MSLTSHNQNKVFFPHLVANKLQITRENTQILIIIQVMEKLNYHAGYPSSSYTSALPSGWGLDKKLLWATSGPGRYVLHPSVASLLSLEMFTCSTCINMLCYGVRRAPTFPTAGHSTYD